MLTAEEAKKIAARADAHYITNLVEDLKKQIFTEIEHNMLKEHALINTQVTVDYPLHEEGSDSYILAANKRVADEIVDYFQAYGFKVVLKDFYRNGRLTVSWPLLTIGSQTI